jgi:hypothetical protein
MALDGEAAGLAQNTADPNRRRRVVEAAGAVDAQSGAHKLLGKPPRTRFSHSYHNPSSSILLSMKDFKKWYRGIPRSVAM